MGVSVNMNDPVDTSKVAAKTAAGSTSVDLQSQFLTLLVAQLKNQDPTNPMDNSQLTTQLAQISTLSGIENLNTTLGSISGQITTSQTLQASTLVGHGVMIDGNTILLGSDSTATPFGLSLDSASEAITVTIKDASGNVVRTDDLGAQTAGVHSYSWDGTDSAGTALAAGSYTFSIAATSPSGAAVTAAPLKYAVVYGVNNNATGASQLNLGLAGNVTLDQVRQII